MPAGGVEPGAIKRRPCQSQNRFQLDRLFEEPTYLVLINVPLVERFQFETTLHVPAERGAGELPAQARFAPVDTSKIAFHRDEMRLYGNSGVH